MSNTNAKVVFANILESMGMEAKTAKTFASKWCNKFGIEKDSNGFVTVADAISALTQAYTGETNTSKYKAPAEKAIETLKAGDIANFQTPVTTAAKTDAFLDAKVFKALKEVATNKNWTEVLTAIDQITKKLIAEKEAKAK